LPLTDYEKALCAVARKYIATGHLPRTVPASVWAGLGSRHTCSLCQQAIEPAHAAYELTDHCGEAFHFHIGCHAIWQLAANDSELTATMRPTSL
jgi:hypothetical protein